MGTIYARGEVLYIGFKDAAGRWVYRSSGCKLGDELGARGVLRQVEEQVEKQGLRATAPDTVGAYFEQWIEGRRARGLTSTRHDEQRLTDFCLPALGRQKLADVRPREIRALFAELRPRRAPRTVMNTYGALHRLFEDAMRDELIDRNPCQLEVRAGELPGRVDKDRAWRAKAIFTRAELEQLISSDQLTEWARMFWAMGLLSGMRLGEIAALRWSDYDSNAQPLGGIYVHSSYTRQNARVKSTKTEAPRRVPVHPELAAMLAEWKLGGWARQFGRQPTDADLMMPNQAGRHFNDLNSQDRAKLDLAALGLRHRRYHDTRRTFITLTRGDGAVKDLLHWVTHGPSTIDIDDTYTTPEWPVLCAQVEKLRVGRRGLTSDVLQMTIRRAANAETTEEKPSAQGGIRTRPQGSSEEKKPAVSGSLRAIALGGKHPAQALRSNVVSELASAAERVQAGEAVDAQVISILATLRGGR